MPSVRSILSHALSREYVHSAQCHNVRSILSHTLSWEYVHSAKCHDVRSILPQTISYLVHIHIQNRKILPVKYIIALPE